MTDIKLFNLHIDKSYQIDYFMPVVIDIETNETGVFVGLGLTQNGQDIYYFTSGNFQYLQDAYLITHGGVYDIRQLRSWGVNVTYGSIKLDTKVLIYCMDSTLKKYGLKELAKKHLKLEWPSYKEMVGTGKKKKTLDQLPTEDVANYCGHDVYATYHLWKYGESHMSENQIHLYDTIEMPLYRLLAQMEDLGVYVDTNRLNELEKEFRIKMTGAEKQLLSYGKVNPRSPKQLLPFLRSYGIKVSSTNEKALEAYSEQPVVKKLLEYRKYKKLLSTYIEPYIQCSTLPILHPRLHQSTETGRLASS